MLNFLVRHFDVISKGLLVVFAVVYSMAFYNFGAVAMKQELTAKHTEALLQKEAEYRALEKRSQEKVNAAWEKASSTEAELNRALGDNQRLVIRVRELADRRADAAREADGTRSPAGKADADDAELAAEGAELLAEVAEAYGRAVVQLDALIEMQ